MNIEEAKYLITGILVAVVVFRAFNNKNTGFIVKGNKSYSPKDTFILDLDYNNVDSKFGLPFIHAMISFFIAFVCGFSCYFLTIYGYFRPWYRPWPLMRSAVTRRK